MFIFIVTKNLKLIFRKKFFFLNNFLKMRSIDHPI